MGRLTIYAIQNRETTIYGGRVDKYGYGILGPTFPLYMS